MRISIVNVKVVKLTLDSKRGYQAACERFENRS